MISRDIEYVCIVGFIILKIVLRSFFMAPKVCHYGPLTAIILITLISCSASYSAYQLWSLPAHVVYYFRAVHFTTMYTWLILIAKNFIQAIYTTGYVPAGWSPVGYYCVESLK